MHHEMETRSKCIFYEVHLLSMLGFNHRLKWAERVPFAFLLGSNQVMLVELSFMDGC